MHKNFFWGSAFLFALTSCVSHEVDTSVYLDPSRSVDERVEALLSQMTLDEKIGQMDMVSEWDQDSILNGTYYDFGAWIAGQEPADVNRLQALSEKNSFKDSLSDRCRCSAWVWRFVGTDGLSDFNQYGGNI